MDLHSLVAEFFAPQGGLVRLLDGFQPRAGQTEMALAVADVVEQGGSLVVEAGTGVGKTFAYLVPVLMSGERVLLSTATKALQDQLFGRDLPRLLRGLAIPVSTALLKGRSSYLCLHRMGQARHGMPTADSAALRQLSQVEAWSQVTRSGDLAELPALDERSPLVPRITSTRENCLGANCPQFQACHVNLARRQALGADVVVINHHLFFADMAVRESGVAELLPSVRVVVFDEAHQLNDIGVQFLGTTLGTGQLLDFCRDVLATGLQLARGLVDWQSTVAEAEQAARRLRLVVGKTAPGARLRWATVAPEGVQPDEWVPALQQLREALVATAAGLDTVSEIAPDFGRLFERAVDLLARVDRFARPEPEEGLRWVDMGSRATSPMRLVEAPLDIANAFTAQRRASAAATERERTWVFTSATLGHDARLSWFTDRCGLADAQVLRVDSPFNYAAQAAVYVPAGLPRPSEPGHSAAVAALVAQAAVALGGRTLVLTTTLKALRAIGDALAATLAPQGIAVLVQGQWPKRRLMDRFRQGSQGGQPGCVLVASASFWEGFDVPGEALQLVVIDKLPFPPPNDPVVEARSQRLEAEGRNAFNAYFVPEATVALKQGAGRLIRSETDRGLLVIADTRLLDMGYGRRMLAALPAMRRLKDATEWEEALSALSAPVQPVIRS